MSHRTYRARLLAPQRVEADRPIRGRGDNGLAEFHGDNTGEVGAAPRPTLLCQRLWKLERNIQPRAIGLRRV